MNAHKAIGGALILVFAGSWNPAGAAEPSARAEWRFRSQERWNGWIPSGGIEDAAFDGESVRFRATGGDPQILGPLIDQPATNLQWVEIELDSDGGGEGELFYTNKTTGRYGGLEPAWMARLVVPSAGRQIVRVWPFWEGLGKIVRLRFDPPDGMKCRLHAIRIMESRQRLLPPDGASGGPAAWQVMHAARLEREQGTLRAHALRPQALIIMPVEPFDASRRSLLTLRAACPGEDILGLYWVAREHPGLMGEPIRMDDEQLSGRDLFDLRQFPTWEGTITHLALAFGTFGGETLTLREFSIASNEPGRPLLRLCYLGFDRPINRAGGPATLKAILEHAGGPPVPAGTASLVSGDRGEPLAPASSHPGVDPGGQLTLTWDLTPSASTGLRLIVNRQTFAAHVRVDALEGGPPPRADAYAVPPPRPVKTRYNLGIYYFPGWSGDQIARWEKQRGYPEREPVLGWYAEGEPEVADWHVKWAVENGLSFFIYDWYWRDGREELAAGLNHGFLKARYNGLMKFAVMWANHKPFSSHTPDQLLQVTDYWVEHYFRRLNYLTVDSRPYVSFFSPGELIGNLGSAGAARAALEAMRQRARAAGLGGLHLAACGGTDVASLKALKEAGFDSVTGYNYLRTGAVAIHSPYRQFLLGHEELWRSARSAAVLPYIPLLTVGWDARPWHGPRTERKFARRTRDFEEALRHLKAHLDATGAATGILEAWNEWGEGSYIEPNVEFGFSDLEAIRRVFAEPGDWPPNIGPADLGMEGRYDLRLRPGKTR